MFHVVCLQEGALSAHFIINANKQTEIEHIEDDISKRGHHSGLHYLLFM